MPVDPDFALTRINELQTMYTAADLNVAHLLCDSRPATSIAFTVLDTELEPSVVTYGVLRQQSERLAGSLRQLGVVAGDRVATLLGKSVHHLVSVMAIWRLGAVHVPLFTAFAPGAISMRLATSCAKAVICDENQRSKLLPGDDMPADPIWDVIVVGEVADDSDFSFEALVSAGETGFSSAALGGDAPFIEIYTSGTTGRPKPVVVPARAIASFRAYMELGLDVQPDDVFWNAADPGWAFGLYYGIIGSLCLGVPGLWLSGGSSPQRTLATLQRQRVTNFAAAPTVFRALAASAQFDLPDLCLRRASCAGEPLTPEINGWARQALSVEVHDHYGQTETGMTIVNGHHPSVARALRSGSIGRALPGWIAQVLDRNHDVPADTGAVGRIAFDISASPLAWFAGYRGEPDKSDEKFSDDGRWYLTGDSGSVDQDGYFSFHSRDDDVIIMAGYRIGPTEVESVLLLHPKVSEAAVIAAPDQLRGEVIEAYVVLVEPSQACATLALELQRLVKSRLAAHAYPRVVHFIADLPKTPSGKIQRKILKEDRRLQLEYSITESETTDPSDSD